MATRYSRFVLTDPSDSSTLSDVHRTESVDRRFGDKRPNLRHLDAAGYQALGQQTGGELLTTVMPRRSAPSDRRRHGHLHREIPMRETKSPER